MSTSADRQPYAWDATVSKSGPCMILIEGMSYWYPTVKAPTLKAINLHIVSGELVLVSGPSGAGKSTLFHCMKGLLPHLYGGRLDGRIEIGGADLSKLGVAEIAQRVGLVMQDPTTQFCNLFVRDEVAFGVENLRLDRDTCIYRVNHALDALDLCYLADKQVMELSEGDKQSVAIASVLAMDVPVMLLDEPTANVDPRSARQVLRFVAALREAGRTILVIQHELDNMIHVADKLLLLENGAVLDYGAPRDLIERYGDRLTSEHNVGLPQVANAALRTRRWFRFEGLPLTADEFCSMVRTQSHGSSAMPPQSARKVDNTSSAEVEAEGVSFTYPRSERPAVKAISLTVRSGEVVAIVGKNGAGKTTLGRLLVGLLRPQDGVVRIGGEDTTNLSRHEIHRKTGYVFQYPEHQFLADTVRDEVAYGLEVQGRPEEEIERIVVDVLKRLGLTGMESRHPFTLSGGEKRRLSVATMLVLRPRLLILDEPTYGLDEGNLINLLGLILDQFRAEGTSILFITHDMRLVAEHAQRVLALHEGRKLFDGRPSALFSDTDLLVRAELVPPPVVELVAALDKRGFSLPGNVTTLEQFCLAVDGLFASGPRGAKTPEGV